METLKCEKRIKSSSHSARRSRRMGKIPGVLYSSSLGNIMFEVADLDFNREIQMQGEHSAISLIINKSEHKALIKELQKEPVTQKIIHIDLQEINDQNVIQTEVPIVFVGESIAAKNGGIIQKERNNVKIQGKYNDIPKVVNVDVSKMQIGDVFRIADLELAKEITFLDDINSVLAVVSKSGVSFSDQEEINTISNVNEKTQQ
ncbi:general stress protein CTC [Clostridium homopropionicum DSM 5847]|uniref:Large ribosomal subunit protein bL25 n=1 Tax=Clostridium homopropionicum DSM 5847 TaxID=1121318 RepID=A0A0L6ZBC4_9CLOT|nr:50S ribosomal protein L25 [Clostridium homopropionicum]KOA20260.1 general stress protein CTC [Clostridium homopropionicum DSM 5847]SFG57275.1 LSU ribosomal protein L25P [Clostridium homopropionicum]